MGILKKIGGLNMIYDYKVEKQDGSFLDLKDLKGKVILMLTLQLDVDSHPNTMTCKTFMRSTTTRD